EVTGLMNAIPKIVFSRTLTSADWNNSRLVKEATDEEVARLKSESAKDLFIFGSANLSDTLTTHGLIDEYRICIVPVVLGGGIPLFKPSAERLSLRLLESRPLASGGVILRYEPDRGASPAV
ncbi:MAG TPA: dihydrofolate reductase family protein, partial [Gemmatimonadaceae bacterium]